MATTTFSGPVRSENGFIGGTKNSSTGAFTANWTINASGAYVGTQQEVCAVLAGSVEATAGTNELSFSQPNNTVITKIELVVTSAPTVATGDIGFQVGTATGGAQLVAAAADQILDGGTTVPAGAHFDTTLLDTTPSDAAPAASPRANVSGVARDIFLQITNTTNASASGEIKWLVSYKYIA
jgi:hypothetical protein